MHTLSIRALIQALQQRQLSSVELIQHCFKRIKEAQSLNTFITLTEEDALAQAK